MKKKIIILISLFAVLWNFAAAQKNTELDRRLQGKTRLDEIIPVVENYYKSSATIQQIGNDEANRQLKHWSRYEWYMSRRLGPNGEFVNINQKMIDATGVQQNRALNVGRGNEAQSASGNWVPVGPFNTTSGIGRVDRLAFHPTDADIVYAGTTAGGLWRTIDAGSNWTNISQDISSAGIGGIVIDYTNTSTIYLLTGDGDSNIGGLVDDFGYMRLSIGVLKSTNGGTNWFQTGDFPGADYTTLVSYRLVMHPAFNNILYACTNQGLYWTTNGGDTWALLNGSGRFTNFAFQPGSQNICYATGSSPNRSRSYYWRSTTSGLIMDSIAAVNNQINTPTRRVELAVAPSNPNTVYLLAGGVPNSPSGQFKGLYRSTDQGQTFSLRSSTPNILGRANDGSDNAQQSNYDLAIAVSNTTSATVVTGAIEVWRSLNFGSTWASRGNLHDDVHDLGFHPVDNKLWAATDGGVYSSIDNGFTWTSHFQDMNVSQFYRMAVNPDEYLNMIAGAQDNGTKRRTGNTSTFDNISGADGFTVGYDAGDASVFYGILNTNVVRFTNNGDNRSSISPPNSNNPFSMSLAPHSTLGNALFIGSDTVWRTIDAGANWTATNVNAGWFMRTCPSNGNRIYAAGGNAYNSGTGILRRSDNSGVTWPVANILSNNPGFPNNYPKITCINVDPTNSLRVWVTFGGFTNNVKVYYSSNGGGSWVNRSGTLPNVPINTIAIDNSNNAYVGTDNGIYYRGAGMNDWVPFYNNLPYVPVTDIIISEAENRIRAATFGRGIWSSDLYSTCPANLNINGILEGQEFYTASNSVTSDAGLLTSEGTKVQMRGGNEVHLLPGFTARQTTQFRALIGPCGGGGVAGFRFASTDSSVVLPPLNYLQPKDGKNALLHVESINNSTASLLLNLKDSGEIKLVVTDEDGKILLQEEKGNLPAGKNNQTFSLNGLPKGLHYIHVLLNGRWEHIQEIDL